MNWAGDEDTTMAWIPEHRQYRRGGTSLLAALLLALPAGGGASTAVDDFHRGTVIAEDELSQMRAGFNIAGLEMDFGARLQTRIDDSLELVSLLNVTRRGTEMVDQQLYDHSGGLATLVGADAGVRLNEVTPAGVDLTGLADFSGVTIQDASGFSAALHGVTRNAILAGVVSNASGRVIQQRLDVSVHLRNVGEVQAARQRAAILDSFSGLLR
jgi:hypothetical protein